MAEPRPVLIEKCFDGTHAALCKCHTASDIAAALKCCQFTYKQHSQPLAQPGHQMCHRSVAAVTSTLQLLVTEKNTIYSASRVAPRDSLPLQSPVAALLGGSRAWQGCKGINVPPLNLVVASWVLTGEACNVQKSPSCSCSVVQDKVRGWNQRNKTH